MSMTGEARAGGQFIPLDVVGVAPRLIQPEVGQPEGEEFHPHVRDEYIVPRADAVNSRRIAGIVAEWINSEPATMINHHSADWILDKWAEGHGIMVLVEGKDQEPVDIFGQEDLTDETLRRHILSAAFLKPLEKPMEEEVELGTVISNPNYRSHPGRRRHGLSGGKRAFQAVQDLAHNIYPQARIFTWVHDGSKRSAEAAFDGSLREYIVDRNTEPTRFEAIFGVCEAECPNFNAQKGACCHTGYEIPNEELGFIHQRSLQVE